MRQNPEHYYGRKTEIAEKKAPQISKILNNGYLKEQLTDRIAAKALEVTDYKPKKIDHTKANKALKFRSGSKSPFVPSRVKAMENAIMKKYRMSEVRKSFGMLPKISS